MAVLFPGVYMRWRAPLCLLSHVAHKLAQSAVTLLPPVGTIFSPTYNPTVALLESSSLAQVHMLSFGMRLHFGAHLAAMLTHLGLAVAANDAICAAGFPSMPGGGAVRGPGPHLRSRTRCGCRPVPCLPRTCTAGLPAAQPCLPATQACSLSSFAPPRCCPGHAGGACNVLMVLWQVLACFALPCTLVYVSERRSRRIFLETVSD
jgi:hypothetical protein